MITDIEIINKIQLIKIIRIICDFGLVESKAIVERWLNSMHLNKINNTDNAGEQILMFIRFVETFKSGKNVIDSNGEIRPVMPAPLTDEDICNLSKYGVGN